MSVFRSSSNSFENLEIFLEEKGIKLSGNQAMIDHEEVHKLYEEILETEMANFSKYERIKKFALIPELLTIEKVN